MIIGTPHYQVTPMKTTRQSLSQMLVLWLAIAIGMSACGSTAPAAQPSVTPGAAVVATSTPSAIATPAPATPTVAKTLPAPADDADAAARLARAIVQQRDSAAMVEVLARAGIYTTTAVGGAPLQAVNGEPSVLTVVEVQTVNMTREAGAGMGTLGSALDAVAPGPDIPPLSYLLATYVLDAQTFGGAFSRALMADAALDTPPQVIFPTIVLTLFVADMLAPAREQASNVQLVAYKHTTNTHNRPISAAYKMAPAGPCGAMTGALENVLERILSNVLGSFIGSIVAGAAVRYGMEYLSDALSNLPIIKQIRQALAVVAMVAQFGSLLRNWSVQLTSDGSTYHYDGGGGSPSSGTFTATVDAGGTMRVPPAVSECAALARITIPEISGAEGSEVVWTPGAGWNVHAKETTKDAVVAADQTAKLAFSTAAETALDHAHGTAINYPVSMQVSIKRNDVAQIKGVIGKAVNDLIGIPGVGGLVQSVVETGLDALADTIMNPQAQASIAVASELHPWESRYTQPGSCGGLLTLEARSCSGLAGPWTMVVVCTGQINGSTTTTFTFDKSTPSPPPVAVEWHLKGNSMQGMLTPGTICDGTGCTTVSEPAPGVFHIRYVGKDGGVYDYDMGQATQGMDINLDWFGTAELRAGQTIHAEGTTSATGYMGNGATSNDSVDFTLVPRPDQPLCTQGQSGGE
jgi:hypothetical protein